MVITWMPFPLAKRAPAHRRDGRFRSRSEKELVSKQNFRAERPPSHLRLHSPICRKCFLSVYKSPFQIVPASSTHQFSKSRPPYPSLSPRPARTSYHFSFSRPSKGYLRLGQTLGIHTASHLGVNKETTTICNSAPGNPLQHSVSLCVPTPRTTWIPTFKDTTRNIFPVSNWWFLFL